MLKSGEGLSVPFILLWLAGDVTNLLGGALAHLLPTMITLAVYVSKGLGRLASVFGCWLVAGWASDCPPWCSGRCECLLSADFLNAFLAVG